jgi:hypothetical protein
MRWYHYVATSLGAHFLRTRCPHLGNGISGHAFQSPGAGILIQAVMLALTFGPLHGGR